MGALVILPIRLPVSSRQLLCLLTPPATGLPLSRTARVYPGTRLWCAVGAGLPGVQLPRLAQSMAVGGGGFPANEPVT